MHLLHVIAVEELLVGEFDEDRQSCNDPLYFCLPDRNGLHRYEDGVVDVFLGLGSVLGCYLFRVGEQEFFSCILRVKGNHLFAESWGEGRWFFSNVHGDLLVGVYRIWISTSMCCSGIAGR